MGPWISHPPTRRNSIVSTRIGVEAVTRYARQQRKAYLRTLIDLDGDARRWIRAIVPKPAKLV